MIRTNVSLLFLKCLVEFLHSHRYFFLNLCYNKCVTFEWILLIISIWIGTFFIISTAAVGPVDQDMAGIVVVLVVVEDILDIVAWVRQQDIVDNQDTQGLA